MGDLNAQPDFDVISRLRGALCDVSKLTDCEKPTFDSLNPYMKIDYIFTGGDIKVLGSDIVRVVCSDHLPVTAKIEI
jgi:endonuclease/exonuclease/phosphatase family metal-dependent hydrolase